MWYGELTVGSQSCNIVGERARGIPRATVRKPQQFGTESERTSYQFKLPYLNNRLADVGKEIDDVRFVLVLHDKVVDEVPRPIVLLIAP